MSLATRCTACGTIFRVVQDQLRVSEGWVRCGRCAEVFDAREQLFDIDREAPPPWPLDAREVQPEAEPALPEPAIAASPPEPDTWQQRREPVPEVPPEPAMPADAAPDDLPESPAAFATEDDLPAPRDSLESRFDAAPESRPEPRTDNRLDAHFDSRLEPQWIDEPTPSPRPPMPPAQPARTEPPEPPAFEMGDGPDVVLAPHLARPDLAGETEAATTQAQPPARPQPMPGFMRQAEGAARWRRPQVRVALGATAAVLVTLLGLQMAHHFRDAIVALHPQLRGSLQALCEATGCELKPWQRIDAVSVENSGLNQIGSGHQYQLAVNLHNKSAVDVATPWIELSLTDAAGSLLVRKVLAPKDFRTGKDVIAAGTELPLQLQMSTGEQRVNSYSVEIFHP